MSILTTKPLQIIPTTADAIRFSAPAPGVWSPWIEFIASAASALQIAGFVAKPGSIQDYDVEVGIGAVGAEQGIGNFLLGCYENSGNSEVTVMLPIPVDAIPAGSRVSIRSKNTGGTGTTIDICLLYYAGLDSDYVVAPPLKYGYMPEVTSTSGITQNASATAWANVAYTQFTPGLSSDCYLLGITFATSIVDDLTAEIDLASGAAGAETVLTTILSCSRAQGFTNMWLPAPLPVPANTRIAFRTRSANATTAKTYGISLILLVGPSIPRVTQDAIELLNQPVPEARVTQHAIELLNQPLAEGRITQHVTELLSEARAQAWITQFATETLSIPSPAGLVSQLVVETLTLPPANPRMSQLVVETLTYAPESVSTGTQVAIWMGDSGGNIWIE